MSRALRQSGFTLLEVMVALAIFAVAAVALTKAGMSYVNAVQSLETRTLAHFVAMNEAANMTVTQAWLDGSAEHNVEEQGRHWQIGSQAYPISGTTNIRRVVISIKPIETGATKPGDVVTTLVIFIHQASSGGT
jgi:general secretion pathway protein I